MPDLISVIIESLKMESRSFIREAKLLMVDIDNHIALRLTRTSDELHTEFTDLQKRINNLYSGLQNPSLPSAFNLRDKAVASGFTVDNKAQHKMAQFEDITG